MRMLVRHSKQKSVTVNRADVSDHVCLNLVDGNNPEKKSKTQKVYNIF